jgi:hypothetical protein
MALGYNSSVINDPLGELGHTPFYAGLPSDCGSADGDRRWVLETKLLSVLGNYARGTWRDGSFSGNSDSYVRRKEGFGNGASLSLLLLLLLLLLNCNWVDTWWQ